MLTVHFFHSSYKIARFLKADKSESFALAGPFVTYHFGLYERWIFVERARQQFVVDIVAQITAKYSKIIVGPIGQRMILPHLAASGANCLLKK